MSISTLKVRVPLLLVLLCIMDGVKAQDSNEEGFALTKAFAETRMAFEGQSVDGNTIDDNTGFKGQYLNLRLDGQIAKGLSFSYRQRFNKNTNATFFDATDWLHVDWKATDKLSLGAGKQVVAIGGYEYDRAPIDLYYCSEFWNNIPCYQLGVSATYNVSANDQVLAQVGNSPMRPWVGNNKYALNLMWYGSHGFWETMWSVNFIQSANDNMMNYIALGNRFNITDKVHLDADVMNRASKDQSFLFDDWSLMTELSVQPTEGVRLFGKYTHDENHSGTSNDVLVMDGTDINMASVGVEYAPLKQNRDAVRLFAAGSYNWGTNGNPEGTKKDKEMLVQVGMKIKVSK